MRELAKLPVRVGRAEALFDVKERGQLARVRRRSGVELVLVNRDAHAVPVFEPQSVGGRQGGQRVEVIGAGWRADLVEVAHVAPFGQGPVVIVEGGERGLPVLAGPGRHNAEVVVRTAAARNPPGAT